MAIASAKEFEAKLSECARVLRTAKKNRVSLASHSFYSQKVRTALASLRKSFLALKRDYPNERFPKVAFQLATTEPMLQRLVAIYPTNPAEMLKLLDEITFKVETDLAAELESPDAILVLTTTAPFLPNDLVEDRYFVMKQVLWEANRCYEAACYNACATMIRRLVENLIIEAFEHQGLGHEIKNAGEYLDFGGLVGKAIAEPTLRLTRNTKKLLPHLKFFGDLGAHNRMALVRKDDLDRLHNAIRAGIEELARNT